MDDREGGYGGEWDTTLVNLNNFDTSKVYNMAQMFYSCKSLISLDLTSFITSNVKAFAVMFKEFINL